MKTFLIKTVRTTTATVAIAALLSLGSPLGSLAVAHASAPVNPTTLSATAVTASDATLNGMNGGADASDSSFWVSTSTFSTPTNGTPIPSGVYSTAVLGSQASSTAFSAPLSSVTGLPAIMPNTMYYYSAWTEVDGTWSAGAVMSFTTTSAPTISTIAPTSGSMSGGTPITITGTGFVSGAMVMVGGVAATDVSVASSTSITAMTPVGTAGSKDVIVTNTDTGMATATGGFTYVASATTTAPTTLSATAVTASDATLNGMNGGADASDSSFWVSTSTFSTPTNGTPIPSGVYSTPLLGATASSTAFSAALSSVTGLPAIMPNTMYYYSAWTEADGVWSAGSVMSVMTATATAPTVTAVTPATGSTAGGTAVTITGMGFTGATAVDFGTLAATSFVVNSDSSITATSPATSTEGMVDVMVTTPVGMSAASADVDQFTYSASSGSIGGTVTGGPGVLTVTSITPVQTNGTSDNTYTRGWSYLFNITMPTNESNLSMEFSNWLASDTNMIPVAGNMQLSSAQASSTAPVTLNAANAFSSPALHMVSDLSTTTPGLQVQVLVQVKIPLNTENDSYTTSYGVQTLP